MVITVELDYIYMRRKYNPRKCSEFVLCPLRALASEELSKSNFASIS
jgi:hypothetical protein